ncbi:amino acid-binding ACT domain protein [Corynebacterium uberis]|uniref:amino acid-binding ACT domain protein n=1 Tax=Corynebacterium TaxID=1716 RepID=UPI001D0AF9FB|nr:MULTISPECIES: amino acid-binding ACT domain protein [Corynebacterium]MCZ9309078.1 amino acid-binding ACT domain protein [Corynebacterium sp. c6VSa_13]UDL74457.1 amino acid-binding ACT domain protein [Corynebacterium uberis]UDL76708.1 amino acid-binding ACT domain protein [Corynebacterium uberis]UDL78921.1 amino acid-binding ACT domain protein [Corynebacterium uberis]UDL81199.1 amino acid-binding ACT domain protein [Corynebacterium uberis]
MSYLIRVLLPDSPGSLALVADSMGRINANIQSVDVVETFPDGTAMDDLVVELPPATMADVLVSAAQAVDGVLVDSIRPFSGRVDRRGQIAMLAEVAQHARDVRGAMNVLVSVLPRSMTSSWALVLDTSDPVTRVAGSSAAPEDNHENPESIPITTARVLNPETEAWIPRGWALLDSALAAAPLPGTNLVVVTGRTGGPDYLASEVSHLGHLATVCGAILS